MYLSSLKNKIQKSEVEKKKLNEVVKKKQKTLKTFTHIKFSLIFFFNKLNIVLF